MSSFYCITEDLIHLGGNDRRLALFENVYPIPNGISYNSYLMKDEKNVLLDTVDGAIAEPFTASLKAALNGEPLDYVIVNHMEPDHAATLGRVLKLFPAATVVGNSKTFVMLDHFFPGTQNPRLVVKEGETLRTGKHSFRFFMAPMVHWPEVMVTYEESEKTLFSADAFGTFGAIDGGIFADEAAVDISEYRRYYTNIVGKYGVSVSSLLKKAAGLEIAYLCPLHGRIWRKDFQKILGLYADWAAYRPECEEVVIACGSVYGNTMAAAETLAAMLAARGVKAKVYDVSVTDVSYILAEAFRCSRLVCASATYNAGIFSKMEGFLSELKAHNLQNRTVGLIENGSWAPASGKLMKEVFASMKNMQVLEPVVTLHSTCRECDLPALEALADAIVTA